MKTARIFSLRKFFGYLLVLGCVAVLLYLAPGIWDFRDGLGPGMVVTGADAVISFLCMFTVAVIALSPI